MAQYLSDAWFEEMKAAAESFKGEPSEKRAVTLRETIKGSPVGDVSYVMKLDGESVNINLDADERSDVTFTQSYDTAVRIHKGELTTHEAFFKGEVRVAGHLNTLLDNAELLQGIAPLFNEVRARTTY